MSDSTDSPLGRDPSLLTEDLQALATDAVFASPAKELIVATGDDRIRFLHGLVSGNVAGTSVGAGCHAALLTPKAHVVADLRIFVRADDVLIVVDAGLGEGVASAVSRYAVMDDFAATPRPEWGLLAVLGPAAAARLEAAAGVAARALAALPTWSHADVGDRSPGLWVAAVRQWGQQGFWLAGETARLRELQATLAAVGVRPISLAAAELARIAAREPRWGAEITSDYFPMEVGLSDAIDYGKGCFLGQEPIVRIRDRGHLNWRLVGLDVPASESTDPTPGDALQTDAKPKAGRLTSFARESSGKGVGLALVHASVAAGETVFVVHDGRARVTARVVE